MTEPIEPSSQSNIQRIWTLNALLKGWLVKDVAGNWILEMIHPGLQRFLDEIKVALDAKLYPI